MKQQKPRITMSRTSTKTLVYEHSPSLKSNKGFFVKMGDSSLGQGKHVANLDYLLVQKSKT